MEPTLPISTAAAAFGGAIGYGTWHPRCRWFAPVIYRGHATDPPRAALTFDDGPHPASTPALLEILARHDAAAAFFVIGRHARRHPDLLRRIDAAGHLIASHSFTHAYHGMCRGYRYWRQELARTDEAIADAIGRRPALFRPPMGLKQPLFARALRHHGQVPVTWTRRARDGWPISTQRILKRLIEPTRAGDILTLHDGDDGHGHRPPTRSLEAAPPLIEGLQNRGLQLARLDTLIDQPAYMPQHGKLATDG